MGGSSGLLVPPSHRLALWLSVEACGGAQPRTAEEVIPLVRGRVVRERGSFWPTSRREGGKWWWKVTTEKVVNSGKLVIPPSAARGGGGACVCFCVGGGKDVCFVCVSGRKVVTIMKNIHTLVLGSK